MPLRAHAVLFALTIAAGTAHADESLVVTHRARAMHAGEVLVLHVRAPREVVSVSSEWRERPIAFARTGDGWESLLGLDVEEVPGPRSVRVVARTAGGAELATVHAFEIEPKQWRTRRLTVARRFVTPPQSALPRIREEAELLAAALLVHTPTADWATGFVRPVDGVAVSGFGVRSVLNGLPRGPHNGSDFAAPTGTPIHAPAAGVVTFARPFYYSGNTVMIDHGQGVFSTMAHLSAYDVREGERVTQGQLLGKVGATGRVTGPHLHWAARVNGARVDPSAVLALYQPKPKPKPAKPSQ